MTMASSHTYSTPCYDKDIIPCAFYTMLWQWHHPMFILQHVMTMTLPHVHSTTCNDTDVVPCLFYRNNRITHNSYFICSISHKMITQFRCALFCYAYTCFQWIHYNYAIMGVIASQITSLTSVYSTVCSGVDQRKHQSSASLALNAENASIWRRHHVMRRFRDVSSRGKQCLCENFGEPILPNYNISCFVTGCPCTLWCRWLTT